MCLGRRGWFWLAQSVVTRFETIFLLEFYGSPIHVAGGLSCLFGSEQASSTAFYEQFFLSCLFGSEPITAILFKYALFLSCLFGSELNGKVQRFGLAFLSCLFGSEPWYGVGELS